MKTIQLELKEGKQLLSELRQHYLVEIDFETGEPKADMKILLDLWSRVNNYLQIKTNERENNEKQIL